MASNLVDLRPFQAGSVATPAATLAGFATAVGRWYRNRRDRRALAVLSDAALRDVGLVRGDVERERLRPFWEGVDYDALEAVRRGRSPGGCQ